MSESTVTPETSNIKSVFKTWHPRGFINIGYWPQADKIVVEIGATEQNKTLKSATKCYVPAAQFMAYLYAEVNGRVTATYKNYEDTGVFWYGGGNTADHGVVSRVFTIKMWTKDGAPDYFGRAFSCGHYRGVQKDQGIIEPVFKDKISLDMIKMSTQQIAELYQILSVEVIKEKVLQTLDAEDAAAYA